MATTQFNTQTNTQTNNKAQSGGNTPMPRMVTQGIASAGALDLKNSFNLVKKTQKVNSFNDAWDKAQQSINAAAVAKPVKAVQSAAPATPAAQPTVVTPTWSNDVDYAAQIRQLAATPATAEGQKQMRELAAAREAKILAGGESMAQYANDDVSKMAQSYMRQYVPDTVDMRAYYDQADTLADRMYSDTEASLARQHAAQLETVKQNYDKARREANLAYAMNSRNLENVLAEQGIGRGLGAAPSSGYSETARLNALSNYANNVNQTYAQQDAATRELAAQLEEARLQAMLERNSTKLQNLYARAEQANADRNYDLSVQQYNAGLDQFDKQQNFYEWYQRQAMNNDTLATNQSIKESDANIGLINSQTESVNIDNQYAGDINKANVAAARLSNALTAEEIAGKQIDNQFAPALYESEINANNRSGSNSSGPGTEPVGAPSAPLSVYYVDTQDYGRVKRKEYSDGTYEDIPLTVEETMELDGLDLNAANDYGFSRGWAY